MPYRVHPDMIGRQYSELTLMEILAKDPRGRSVGLFICTCGRERTAVVSYVVRGAITRCQACASAYKAQASKDARQRERADKAQKNVRAVHVTAANKLPDGNYSKVFKLLARYGLKPDPERSCPNLTERRAFAAISELSPPQLDSFKETVDRRRGKIVITSWLLLEAAEMARISEMGDEAA